MSSCLTRPQRWSGHSCALVNATESFRLSSSDDLAPRFMGNLKATPFEPANSDRRRRLVWTGHVEA
jgi:hypothetical protein